MKAIAHLQPWTNQIDILLFSEENGRRTVVTDLVASTLEPGTCVSGPSLTMEREEAQALMDSLWQCGLRPSEGTGSAGALAATQRHLEDMRKLVFEGTSR